MASLLSACLSIDVRPRRMVAAAATILSAQVALAQVIRGTVTDDVGHLLPGTRAQFSLRLPAGRYLAEAARLDFACSRIGYFDIGLNDTLELTFQISELPELLLAMQITAERRTLETHRVWGMNPKAIMGTIFTPTEVALSARGARN